MLTSKPSTEDSGFIILETNSRLYAYTDSELQINVLKLFVVIKPPRFANMVVGMITRDSIRRALNFGITADQVYIIIIYYISIYLFIKNQIIFFFKKKNINGK